MGRHGTIAGRKAAQDSKRAAVFTKYARLITVAAKAGGDPDYNPSLRQAIDKAKGIGMPNDNITRAIKKGTGELGGESYENVTFEGYGAGGVAVIVETLTDNRNRTTASVKHAFDKYNGNFGVPGCVSYMFSRKGVFVFDKETGVTEDQLMEVALEAGAEDVVSEDGGFTVKCQPSDFTTVLEAIKGAGIAVDEENSEERALIPNMTAPVDDVAVAKAINKFVEMLENLEDVQDVYTNMETSDAVDAALEAEG